MQIFDSVPDASTKATHTICVHTYYDLLRTASHPLYVKHNAPKKRQLIGGWASGRPLDRTIRDHSLWRWFRWLGSIEKGGQANMTKWIGSTSPPEPEVVTWKCTPSKRVGRSSGLIFLGFFFVEGSYT